MRTGACSAVGSGGCRRGITSSSSWPVRGSPTRQAIECTLISSDSTIRSNLSVGLPIDILMLRANQFEQAMKPPHRVERDDPYFLALRDGWSAGLRKVFDDLPNEPWFAE